MALLFLLPGLGISQGSVTASTWAESSPKVDGLDEEWRSDSLSNDKSSAVDYAFRNDGRNLYLLLVVPNREPLLSLEATGLALYAYPAESRQRGNGVRFVTINIKSERFIAILESQGGQLTEEEKVNLLMKPQHPVFVAVAVDKKGNTLGLVRPSADADPPAFAAATQADAATFEFRVPLASPEATPAGIGAKPGSTIQVSLEWGGSAKKILTAKGSWQSPRSIASGDVMTGSYETRAQDFLSQFDAMSRQSRGTRKYSLTVDVKLAERQ